MSITEFLIRLLSAEVSFRPKQRHFFLIIYKYGKLRFQKFPNFFSSGVASEISTKFFQFISNMKTTISKLGYILIYWQLINTFLFALKCTRSIWVCPGWWVPQKRRKFSRWKRLLYQNRNLKRSPSFCSALNVLESKEIRARISAFYGRITQKWNYKRSNVPVLKKLPPLLPLRLHCRKPCCLVDAEFQCWSSFLLYLTNNSSLLLADWTPPFAPFASFVPCHWPCTLFDW